MKKKILLVINTLGLAGAERAFIELLNNIDYEKYDTDLFVLTGMGELFLEIPREVNILNQGFKPRPVLNTAGQNSLRRLVIKRALSKTGIKNWPYIWDNLRLQIRQGAVRKDKLLWKLLSDTTKLPDKIQTTVYDTAVAFIEGGSTYFVANHVKAHKKVAFVHVGYTQAGYNRKLDEDAYAHFDHIYTVSEDVRQGFLEIYPEYTNKVSNFTMILNPSAIIKASKDKINITRGQLTLVTVARLTKQKGCELIIRTALALEKNYDYDFVWYIVGNGPMLRQLQSYVKKNGLQDRVVFLGEKNNPYPYFAAADIYVQPSLYEGRSIAVQEAKILQCLMVVTDVTGMNEIVTDGLTGLICKPKSKSIAEAIARLYEDRSLQETIRGQLRLQDYSEDRAKVKHLLEDMLD